MHLQNIYINFVILFNEFHWMEFILFFEALNWNLLYKFILRKIQMHSKKKKKNKRKFHVSFNINSWKSFTSKTLIFYEFRLKSSNSPTEWTGKYEFCFFFFFFYSQNHWYWDLSCSVPEKPIDFFFAISFSQRVNGQRTITYIKISFYAIFSIWIDLQIL